jgi:light-regulated signal transduction histidine kinase (bacteriophytochrome)
LGKNVDLLVPPRYRQSHKNFRAGFFAQQQIRPMGTGRDLYALRKDNTEFPVEIGLAPIDVKGDKLVMATIVDITERKRSEAQLQQLLVELRRSNTELEQFAYVASHDLQEPLRAIIGIVQLLKRRYQGARVDRSDKLFSKIRLKDVVTDALNNLAESIRETEAVVTCDDLPTIVANPSQMLRLFQNLIGNAIKFKGEAKPQIYIASQTGESEWQISVQDNGVGIEPQYFERIFVIFQRLYTRNEYPGTGIGLALCKKIVERHGGRIWVESELGKGSTFYFTIARRELGRDDDTEQAN